MPRESAITSCLLRYPDTRSCESARDLWLTKAMKGRYGRSKTNQLLPKRNSTSFSWCFNCNSEVRLGRNQRKVVCFGLFKCHAFLHRGDSVHEIPLATCEVRVDRLTRKVPHSSSSSSSSCSWLRLSLYTFSIQFLQDQNINVITRT